MGEYDYISPSAFSGNFCETSSIPSFIALHEKKKGPPSVGLLSYSSSSSSSNRPIEGGGGVKDLAALILKSKREGQGREGRPMLQQRGEEKGPLFAAAACAFPNIKEDENKYEKNIYETIPLSRIYVLFQV